MLSAAEIAELKADWEEKQKRKAEKAKEKEVEKGKDDKEGDGKSKDEPSKDKTVTTPPKATSPTPQQPSHEKYALHRDMFALRTAEHRRRKQTAQAKTLAPRLPPAPRSTVN